jgi:glutathione S-transferase
MLIKIYGSARSSAGRCYWLLEEIGVPYERVPLDMKLKEHKSESYLQLNPNGKVPTLIDGDQILWESAAINLYLAEKYKPELMGKTINERAQVYQWTIWAMAELQPAMVDMLIQFVFTPVEKRDPQLIEKAKKSTLPKLEILNKELEKKPYLAGESFTVGDINVATVVFISKMTEIDLGNYPHIKNWITRLTQRPSHLRVVALGH